MVLNNAVMGLGGMCWCLTNTLIILYSRTTMHSLSLSSIEQNKIKKINLIKIKIKIKKKKEQKTLGLPVCVIPR
jgi:hypothetical protein